MQIRISGPVPPGLKVIETMRAEPDGRIALWSLHLDRLRRDCRAVGFPLDETSALQKLEELPGGHVLRVRLVVGEDGRAEVTHQTLPPDPAGWRGVISPVRLDSRDPWLRLKTTHRPAYEAARDAMPETCDEAILLNERGEICEGTITNIFLRQKGRLLTPAISCGLLPGVLRQSLLDRGEAAEAVIRPADLTEGQVFCGNALRGLIPVSLQAG